MVLNINKISNYLFNIPKRLLHFRFRYAGFEEAMSNKNESVRLLLNRKLFKIEDLSREKFRHQVLLSMFHCEK